MRRLDPSLQSAFLTVAVLAAVGVVLTLVNVTPPGSTAPTAAQASGQVGAVQDASGGGGGAAAATPGADGTSTGGGAAAPAAPAAQGGGGAVAAARSGLACAPGRNGGATDAGVSGSAIKIAATTVLDGPGASFLSTEPVGLQAVANRVNRAGGICGRTIQLDLRNDSWNAQLGEQYIQNFVEGDHVFALASSDSEGLRAAGSYIQQQGVPVVGTDGMLIQQYNNPWIWPVATSTISMMHIIAKNGFDRGSQDQVGIVFDDQYHFGVEGAYAYDQAMKRLTGHDIPGYNASLNTCSQRFCGIEPGKSSYASEATQFNQACGIDTSANPPAHTCAVVVLLLEPDTALSFMSNAPEAFPSLGYEGAQPLFSADFARSCAQMCDGMWVWTGYNPPIESFATLPGVQRYVSDVQRESSSVDVSNQFLEGAYDGMELMVEALAKVGPNLTRAALRSTLDSMTYDSGLSDPLSWRSGNHFANVKGRAFVSHFRSTFNGFGDAQTGYVSDPWPGQDVPPGE
ncbi:MAG TPA: ABC transporter substrate-binding protein [Candidatus Dormibacteraeota bacterium]|nr:ABC transporter substrate-binding protein [Candidatus Dormibacteraeota bacterium]